LRRHRDFRIRTFSQAISALGSQITLITLLIQVKGLTSSTVAVGLVGATELIPILICGLVGGALADRYDKRRVVIASELVALASIGLLLTNSLLDHPSLWIIYPVAAISAGVGAIEGPSLDAMLPRYVPHEDLAAAGAVEGAVWVIAEIAGPAIGGVLATVDIPLAYGLDCVSFAISISMLLTLTPLPPVQTVLAGWRSGFLELRDGFGYAASRKDLLGSYVVDTVAMTLAVPLALFPFFAGELHSTHAVGLLYAAESIGALIATLVSGRLTRIHLNGRAIAIAAGCWGGAICLAGLMPSLGLVVLMLIIAGAADMVSRTCRQTMWNQSIPPEFRGRMAGIELLSYSVGPTLGNARAGLMAAGGVRFSIAGGGALCVLGVSAVTAVMPAFRRYDSSTDPNALARKAVG
jgi:MFS family permease